MGIDASNAVLYLASVASHSWWVARSIPTMRAASRIEQPSRKALRNAVFLFGPRVRRAGLGTADPASTFVLTDAFLFTRFLVTFATSAGFRFSFDTSRVSVRTLQGQQRFPRLPDQPLVFRAVQFCCLRASTVLCYSLPDSLDSFGRL